jgi:hypothetical protein
MRTLRRIAVAVLSVMLLSAPVAVADEKRGGSDRRVSVVPADRVQGQSGGRLLGDWFVEILSRPAAASPAGGTANLCLDIGRRGRVLSPAGGIVTGTVIEMTCTVEVGRPVVLVMASADCSSAEPVPFFATTAREQRACALRNLNGLGVTSIEVSVDGGRPVDIHQRRFLEVSRQRSVVFPADPVFGADPGPATFVAAAWMAEIRGMRPGDHTVTATSSAVVDGQTQTFQFIVHFEVVGGHGGHHGR